MVCFHNFVFPVASMLLERLTRPGKSRDSVVLTQGAHSCLCVELGRVVVVVIVDMIC